ncbi:hypothetical protein ACOTCS_18190 [Achromobacter xylosoxidans]
MRAAIRRLLSIGLELLLAIPIGLWLAVALLRARRADTLARARPRLCWQSTPIKSLAYMSMAMRQAGYDSETAVIDLYAINRREDFDHVLLPPEGAGILTAFFWRRLMAYRFFCRSLSRYDVFFMYFDGGVLRQTLLSRWELRLLKLANKRIVLMPYGSDAFVYDNVPVPMWRHALMMSYPILGNHAARIEHRVRQMTRQADIVVGCLVHFSSLPRWDMLPLTCYPVDTEAINPDAVLPPTVEGTIRIAHAANHRGVKGTEFLVKAVDALRQQGYDIELDLIERVPNHEALRRMGRADIYVDQLVMGYALAAQEAMALGRVVISPVDGLPETDLFRTYSYLDECPIVSANQRSIMQVLKALIDNRRDWPAIGRASREFVVRRHSFSACSDMYRAILQRVWHGKQVDLMNYYHPVLSAAVDRRDVQAASIDQPETSGEA